ncbi:hypothetical protein WJX81_000184 [Elliptochloris bilobata]|uniref:SBP-type domain-containing protein n=1 Tax=Elliptochloris bilobata TaxID=381761 RepID=A0AAW1QTZ1_9CHLO
MLLGRDSVEEGSDQALIPNPGSDLQWSLGGAWSWGHVQDAVPGSSDNTGRAGASPAVEAADDSASGSSPARAHSGYAVHVRALSAKRSRSGAALGGSSSAPLPCARVGASVAAAPGMRVRPVRAATLQVRENGTAGAILEDDEEEEDDDQDAETEPDSSGSGVSAPRRRAPRDAPAKRLRCQVESCGRDLNALSTYHQRCRICEVHLKLTSFEHRGKQQRFCQQCGRCHELACFEGVRRSCRNQLAKHNARRRRNHEAAVAARGEKAAARAGKARGKARGRVSQANNAASGCASGGSNIARMQSAPRHLSQVLGDQPEALPTRLAVRLFGPELGQLPAGLLVGLARWLAAPPACVDTCARGGSQLTLQAHVTLDVAERVRAGGAVAAVQHLATEALTIWTSHAVLMQAGDQACLVRGGGIAGVWQLAGAGTAPATLGFAPPPAVEAVNPAVALAGGAGAEVELHGKGLHEPDVRLLARTDGAYVPAQAEAIAKDQLRVRLPAALPAGLIWLEAERGPLLGTPRPLLLLPEGCQELAGEVARLLAGGDAQGADALLVDLGLVLRSRAERGALGDMHVPPTDGFAIQSVRRLLALACDAGAPALAAFLLPEAASSGAGPRGSALDKVGTINAATQGGDGLSLLHRAVRSGSAAMVDALLSFGCSQGFCWRADVRGPRGLTPMHLAALSPAAPAISRLLAANAPSRQARALIKRSAR